MTCAFCGFDFEQKEAIQGCAGCLKVGGGCGLVRCPRCAYESPEPLKLPNVFKLLQQWRNRRG